MFFDTGWILPRAGSIGPPMTMLHTLPSLRFVKMHGLGNDFVIVDARGSDASLTGAVARAVGDRRRGVGFDQLAEMRSSRKADLRLVFWNADGSQAGACGNATRCVAAREMAARGQDTLTLETTRGVLSAIRDAAGRVSVNMGQPQTRWADVPLARAVDTLALPLPGQPAGVGMGNPHCVHVVEDVSGVALEADGARVEHDPLFPQRTNVEYVQVRADGTLRLRVWERGAGVTLACGSGACATAVATHLLGLSPRKVEIEMDGGWLSVDWREDGVWLSGPVAHVFDGELGAEWLADAR